MSGWIGHMILKKAVLDGSGKPSDSSAILGKFSVLSEWLDWSHDIKESSIRWFWETQ